MTSETNPKKPTRILSGVQSNGRLHLGNYFGAIQNHIRLQDEGECFYFIANYHSLTTLQSAPDLAKYTFMAAADYLALGLDPAKALLFRQSDVPEVTELAWILSTVTGMGLLERAHSFKDKIARGIAPSMGLFFYPILMAADILIYQSEKVPVGQDQVQHVEMTRDMAGHFHQHYAKGVFTLPEAVLSQTPKVMGLTGGKMSKSDEASVLPIFGEPAEIKKKVMSIITDSKGVDEPKDPEGNVIYLLYKLLASPEEAAQMAEGFRKGGMGYGDAKKTLLAQLEKSFGGETREKRKAYDAHPDRVEDVLVEGAKKARRAAAATMDRVYAATGIAASRIKRKMSDLDLEAPNNGLGK
ncbi:MAG TPA: tryptophan--tRNA ligase [bacterium]|nr:tryptophan--tRNA ligase [bacterium]